MMRMVCQVFAKSPAPINKARHTYAANEHMPARPLPHAHMGATRFFPFLFFLNSSIITKPESSPSLFIYSSATHIKRRVVFSSFKVQTLNLGANVSLPPVSQKLPPQAPHRPGFWVNNSCSIKNNQNTRITWMNFPLRRKLPSHTFTLKASPPSLAAQNFKPFSEFKQLTF